jgi:DNA-binding CsgD family transcriptional regulator
MLQGVLARIVEDRSAIVERDKGVAFLSAARPIYQLSHLFYFCANIPRHSTGSYVQCAFSSDSASQAITPRPIAPDKIANLEIVKLAQHGSAGTTAVPQGAQGVWGNEGSSLVAAIRLTPRGGETAVLGYSRDSSGCDPESDEALSLTELKILGDYFHSHMLRRNGIDTAEALVVSARELDCLRWIAAGKSAWESSVILGISERTVRFHLNSAREKLNCTTTTQAVAKVVAQQLISL